ncbi:MAG: gas vesicle protein K [Pseudomonadota bacterium]
MSTARCLPCLGKASDRRPDRDLARLLLAIMELLRELMELQAIRHLEAGALTADEADRVGDALARSRAKLVEIAGLFGVDEDELTLHTRDLAVFGLE